MPITELRFGGLQYDAQSGFHTLGKLSCSGKKSPDPKPSSCSALKKQGIFQNAYYNVKSDEDFSKLVYCNMSTPGYENVAEEFIESSESHFVELDETIGGIVSKVEVIFLKINMTANLFFIVNSHLT